MFSNLFFLLTFALTTFTTPDLCPIVQLSGDEEGVQRPAIIEDIAEGSPFAACGTVVRSIRNYFCICPAFVFLSPGVFSFLHNISVVIVPQPSSHMVAQCTCICVCCAVCTSNPFGTIVELISYHLTIIKKKPFWDQKQNPLTPRKSYLSSIRLAPSRPRGVRVALVPAPTNRATGVYFLIPTR